MSTPFLFNTSCSQYLIIHNLSLLTAHSAAHEVHKYFEYNQLFQETHITNTEHFSIVVIKHIAQLPLAEGIKDKLRTWKNYLN